MMRRAQTSALRLRRACGAFRAVAVWLAFALVTGYPAAAWHAIGHLGTTSVQHLHATQVSQPLKADPPCDLDLIFAELAAFAAVAHASALHVAPGTYPVPPLAQAARHAAPALVYRARAPPARSNLA